MLLDGFVQPVHKRKGAAKAGVGLSRIMLQADGLTVLLLGLVHLPLVIKSGAKADAGASVVLYTDRQPIFANGLIERILPAEGIPESCVSFGVIFVEKNGLPVVLLGQPIFAH